MRPVGDRSISTPNCLTHLSHDGSTTAGFEPTPGPGPRAVAWIRARALRPRI